MSGLLDARADLLRRSAVDGVDVLVVGGGINGVGTALEAASRGLRTLLVERDDLGVGTSSRSSKLIHGGLRYLEHYEFGLVREALGERGVLRRLAPHLVRMERFVVPLVGPVWEVPYIAAGLTLYDLLGGRRGGRFRYLTPAGAVERVPSLAPAGLRGAFEYSDGVVDDARFLLAVAETARRMGAEVVTRAEVADLVRRDGRVAGAVVRDRLGSGGHEIAARVVVDASGAFGGPAAGGAVVRSRGIHLVVPRHLIPSTAGLTIRVPDRVVFLIPWDGHWLVGTTDVAHHDRVDRPAATVEEVAYLLDTLERVLDVRIGTEDIVATFAGIRPLAGSDGDDDTAAISREERIEVPEEGMVVIRGGKYTTYRLVAERAVEAGVGPRPRSAPGTAAIPLAGFAPEPALAALAGEVARRAGVGEEIAAHLVSRYGSEAVEVAETGARLGLNEPLVPGLPYLRSEAWWGIHREQALSVDDVLSRRTRVSIEQPDHGAAAAETVAGMLGEALGWDPGRQAEEAAAYRAGAEEEYGVPGRVDEELEVRR